MSASLEETRPRIAIVEDDPDQRESMLEYLELQGYAVWAEPGAEAFYRRMAVEAVDIVILDIGLPGEDGFEATRHIRQNARLGVIIVSARSDLSDRIAGMENGADAYLVKPVELRELALHIEAVWRRLGVASAEAVAQPSSPAAVWRLSRRERQLHSPQQRPVALTPNEFALIECLVAHAGEAPRSAVAESLGSRPDETDYHRIDVLLSRLRKKVLQETDSPLPIASAPAQRLALTEPVRVD